jgi:hypothetical protein
MAQLPSLETPGLDGIGANEYIVNVTNPGTVDFSPPFANALQTCLGEEKWIGACRRCCANRKRPAQNRRGRRRNKCAADRLSAIIPRDTFRF